MKAKTLLFAFAILTFLTLLNPFKVQAQEQASGSSATLNDILIARGNDHRAEILRKYLEMHDSPLSPYAQTFVAQADLYHLDWKFLVAISGVESTFGKAVPCTNAWGWGVYGSHTYCFDSYDNAIRTISKDLREKYIDKWGADDVYSIGRMYASSPAWADHVVYFMNDIDSFAVSQNVPLSISL